MLNKRKSYQAKTLIYNQYIKTKTIKTLFFCCLADTVLHTGNTNQLFFFKFTTFLEIFDFHHKVCNRVFLTKNLHAMAK